MPVIKLRDGDTFESAMRKFKRVVDKARILQELRLREFHLSDSVLKQRRKAAAKKRWAKKLAREKSTFKDIFKCSSHSHSHNHNNYAEKSSKDKEK